MAWSLTYGGTNKAFKAWGLSLDVQPTFSSQAPDELTLTDLSMPFDADDRFAYGSTVDIWNDAVKVFSGTILDPTPSGGASSENKTYRVAGPWYYLEEHVFQQSIVCYNLNLLSNQVAQTTEWSTHLILNLKVGPALATIREQIVTVLDYVLAQYGVGAKPFQKGKILVGHNLYPNAREILDVTCAEVIRGQLVYAPDAVTWFDYSTSPPTLHIEVQKNLTTETLAVDGLTVEQVTLKERKDLQRPCVAIRYETKSTFNGQEKSSVATDIYPADKTGRELHALCVTVPLLGVEVTTTKAEVLTRQIDALSADAATQKAWWLARYPNFSNTQVEDFTIVSASKKAGLLDLAYEIVGGGVADWMVDVAVEEQTFEAMVTYKTRGANGQLFRVTTPEPLTAQFKATNLPGREYETVDSFEEADPQPIGLARFVYDSINIPQYEGRIVIKEVEAGTQWRPGKVVNLTNTAAKYATMKALVQSVSQDIHAGRTTITVGPPSHLSIPDLISLMNVGRIRRRFTPLKRMTEGDLGSGGQVELSKHTANKDSTSSIGGHSFFAVASGAVVGILDAPGKTLSIIENGNKGVAINTAACEGPVGTPRVLGVREVGVCEKVNGVDTPRKMLVVGSVSYD
jgi:hypothetical protein